MHISHEMEEMMISMLAEAKRFLPRPWEAQFQIADRSRQIIFEIFNTQNGQKIEIPINDEELALEGRAVATLRRKVTEKLRERMRSMPRIGP